jgi:hypothetical protein
MLYLTPSHKVGQVYVICFALLAALRDAVFYSMFTLSLITTQYLENHEF